MLNIKERLTQDTFVIEAHGTLEARDYDEITPTLEEALKTEPKLNLVILTREMQGMTPAAVWQDFKTGVRHFNNIRRVALVDEPGRTQKIAATTRSLTPASARYFRADQLNAAREWAVKGDAVNDNQARVT